VGKRERRGHTFGGDRNLRVGGGGERECSAFLSTEARGGTRGDWKGEKGKSVGWKPFEVNGARELKIHSPGMTGIRNGKREGRGTPQVKKREPERELGRRGFFKLRL